MNNLTMQNLCRATMQHITAEIKPGMTLREVRRICDDYMLAHGADSFWYWDVGAFVFAGDETTVSVSGRSYVTSERTIAENDIVTVDLSPQNDNYWGDFARTIIIENGHVVPESEDIQNAEWKSGIQMEKFLHDTLLEIAAPEMTFDELYRRINAAISAHGFVNLDFAGNLGHSIVRNKDDRIYTEKGNMTRLGDVAMFTFEPHISVPGSKYGYKCEDIYYFESGRLVRL